MVRRSAPVGWVLLGLGGLILAKGMSMIRKALFGRGRRHREQESWAITNRRIRRVFVRWQDAPVAIPADQVESVHVAPGIEGHGDLLVEYRTGEASDQVALLGVDQYEIAGKLLAAWCSLDQGAGSRTPTNRLEAS